ncbi:hypothetical protein CSA56_12520 [candidate division KSB3 bacterium]|uniref:Uncharacterized protein n=1 Tax=candidate division KSB3 bacterium TaxID=2044937 RepID=A0A2G6KC64_9BACT|nr:MAG: hypothetical protein CSA56_12520 [candidate division KSB3 bacterium]
MPTAYGMKRLVFGLASKPWGEKDKIVNFYFGSSKHQMTIGSQDQEKFARISPFGTENTMYVEKNRYCLHVSEQRRFLDVLL